MSAVYSKYSIMQNLYKFIKKSNLFWRLVGIWRGCKKVEFIAVQFKSVILVSGKANEIIGCMKLGKTQSTF